MWLESRSRGAHERATGVSSSSSGAGAASLLQLFTESPLLLLRRRSPPASRLLLPPAKWLTCGTECATTEWNVSE